MDVWQTVHFLQYASEKIISLHWKKGGVRALFKRITVSGEQQKMAPKRR